MSKVRVYTDAKKCYDWGWTTEINPDAARTRRKNEPVRLVEIEDEYHANMQMGRYGSGLHFSLDEEHFQEELANLKYGFIVPTP